MILHPNTYVPPGKNVFLATKLETMYLFDQLEEGKWYFAYANWQTFEGPFETEQEADVKFQEYIRVTRAICPSCED